MGDLDFEENLVIVHDGKGSKDRSLPMPKKLKSELKKQVKRVLSFERYSAGRVHLKGLLIPSD